MGKVKEFIDIWWMIIIFIVFCMSFVTLLYFGGEDIKRDNEEKNQYCIDKGYDNSNRVIKEFTNKKFVQCANHNLIINDNGVANFNTTMYWIEYKP